MRTRDVSHKVTERLLEDDLQELFQQLRALYVSEYKRYIQRSEGYLLEDYGEKPMPVWDGGMDKTGRRYKPIWPVLARLAYENRVCPLEMIRAVFFRWKGDKPPTPRHIASRMGLEAVRQFRADKARSLAQTALSQRRILAAELASALRVALARFTREQIITSVIMDRSKASVLVKYCAAVACGALSLAWRLRHKAALEYLAYPEEWAKALDGYLPEDLVEYAQEHVLPSLPR